MLPVASALGKQVSVDLSLQMHLTLQISGQWFAPKCSFSGPRKSLIFSLYSFSHFKDKRTDFQALNVTKLKAEIPPSVF